MSNLEFAIAEWRRQMREAGIRKREIIEELEGHLREDIEREMGNAGVERAFVMAVERLGCPRKLNAEFEVIENRERTFMKRGVLIGAGIIGILIGMAFVMPAVAQYRQIGVMKNDEPWLFLIGSLLTLGGVGAGFRGVMKKRA